VVQDQGIDRLKGNPLISRLPVAGTDFNPANLTLLLANVGSGNGTYRSFRVARPTRASTTEMIQKRTTTVDSCQPFCSK